MAGDYDFPAFPTDEDDSRKVLASIVSPSDAQTIVGPPPNTPPRTGAGVTTPQSGTLAYAPQQATPKISGPAMLPGRAALPETLQAAQSPIGAVQPAIRSGAQPAISRGIQPAQPATINPDPNGSLRPGGSSPGAMPVMPAVQAAQVNAPSQLDRDQSRLNYLTNSGSGVSQIKNKFGRVAGTIGDIALTMIDPAAALFTPGTSLHHQMLLGQQQGIVSNDLEQATQQANLGQIKAKTAAETPFEVTQDQAAAVGLPSLEGATMRPADYAKLPLQNLKNTGTENAAETRGNAMDESTAIRSGLKPQVGADGKTTYVEDPDSPVTQQKQAQSQLAQAKAELARAGNDPRSPAYQLALKRASTAQQNANAATTRATAYMGNYLQGAYNKGLGGDQLPGAPIIQNGQGQGTVVGTRNANTAIKNQANVAQFNDVHGALDSLENSAKALVKSGGKLNSPAVATALAQPPGTLGKWLQGVGAKSGLTPQERDYVIANAAAHENIQALRKAAGGTATDSSVEKLDALIPGASTPDLDYFLRQTGQIRQTAQRLGQGVTTATGGTSVRNPSSTAGQPPQSVVDSMKEGQYVHGPNGSFQKKGGKLVPVGNQ